MRRTRKPAASGGTCAAKAQWTQAYINDLNDSAFLYIEPGGKKDKDGKTVPRTLRHFPVKDADGNLDMDHLDNALSRIPQAKIPQTAKDDAKLKADKLKEQASRKTMPTALAKAVMVAKSVARVLKGDLDEQGANVDQPISRTFQGIPITIDRPKGFVMVGADDQGKEWSRTYTADYGYIDGTRGGDGEGLDVYLGSNMMAPDAYWIIQRNADGKFDEYKLMLGYDTPADAKKVYLEHVPSKFFGAIVPMSIEMVRALLGLEPRETMKKAFVSYLRAVMPSNTVAKSAPVAQPAAPGAPAPGAQPPAPGTITIQASDKIANAVGNAWVTIARLRHRMAGAMGDNFDEHAKAWVKSRGLMDQDADYGGMLGKAVLRMANTFSKEGHSGMSAILARAYFCFLCDAWDGMHTMILNDDDFDKARVALAKMAHATADVFAPDPDAVTKAAATEDRSSVARPVRLVGAEIRKADATAGDAGELRYVLGIVLEPDIVDSQGDTYSADEIRKSMWRYMRDFQNIGLQHKVLVNGRVSLVECYQAPIDFDLEGSTIKKGTWMMGLNVIDSELWQQIKAGDITGLSIAGIATKTPIV